MNIKKMIIGVLILGIFGICALPAYSETIQEQVNRIKPYIESRKTAGLPVYLVMGTSNKEQNLNERFDDKYIFLDMFHGYDDDRNLTIDLNKIGELRQLFSCISETFGGTVFDKIILDGCVYHYVNWSKKHIREFKNALKPGGQFMFKPYELFGRGFSHDFGQGPCGIIQRERPTAEEKSAKFEDLCKKMLNEADETIREDTQEGKLFPRFTYSSVYPSMLWQEVTVANVNKQLNEIAKGIPLNDLSYDIASLYDWDAVQPESGASKLQVIELVIIVIFHKKYVPYYISVLEEVFGNGNVSTTISKRVALPFKANWDFSSSILFTATKI